MAFHHGGVDRIPRGKPSRSEHDLLRALNIRQRNRKHFIDVLQGGLEYLRDLHPAVDGDKPMENLLKHLGIGHELSAIDDQAFEDSLGIDLVTMRASNENHRNVRVNEDQSRLSGSRYPCSISAFI